MEPTAYDMLKSERALPAPREARRFRRLLAINLCSEGKAHAGAHVAALLASVIRRASESSILSLGCLQAQRQFPQERAQCRPVAA